MTDVAFYALRYKSSDEWFQGWKKKRILLTSSWTCRFPFPSEDDARETARNIRRCLTKKQRKAIGKPVLVTIRRRIRPTIPKFTPWAEQLKVVVDVFEQSGILGRVLVEGDYVLFDTDRFLVGMHGVPERATVQIHVGSTTTGGIHLQPSGDIPLLPRNSFKPGTVANVKALSDEIIAYLKEKSRPTP